MSDQASGGDDRGARPASVAYVRPKKTKASVLFADRAADIGITIGGLLVILAVFTIMVFLVRVTLPLFMGSDSSPPAAYDIATGHGRVVAARMDEYQTVSVDLNADGTFSAFHVATGRSLTVPSFDFGGLVPTANAQTLSGDDAIFGFADGTIRLARARLAAEVMPEAEMPAGLTQLNERDWTDGSVVYSRVPGGQVRRIALVLSLEAPQQVAPQGTAIVAVDYRLGGSSERPVKAFVSADAEGAVRLSFVSTRMNMMTGEETSQVSNAVLPAALAGPDIARLLLNSAADRVLIATREGVLYRFNTRNFAKPVLAEKLDLMDGRGGELTALSWLPGEISVVSGTSAGRVSVWFPTDRPGRETVDGIGYVRAHDFPGEGPAITRIAASQRTRMFVTGDAAGGIVLRHATTARDLLVLGPSPDPAGLAALQLAPRDDAVLAVGLNGKAALWQVSVPHPETTPASLVGPVWYEGYREPAYTWQSTAGTDSFEPKLSLVPVIFGTLKAALYSLLFATPIALFAAIYTSEFLHPNVRAVVKPTMELMASLPSVVVGFVAALVLSPIVENWVASVVIAFLVVPLALALAAQLWQVLPVPTAIQLQGLPKFTLYFTVLLGAIWASVAVGPFVEAVFFAGDFKAWSTGRVGDGTGFTALILLPLAFLGVSLAADRLLGQRYRAYLREQTGSRGGLVDLARWLVSALVAAALAWAGAMLLSASGFDPRGGIVGTYVQRNALIVAFAIGFAIVPIIYTIAEDALNAVPEHLRSASLGCGATKWQTAAWVIVPTAMSGIFSAIMIGMGRAVGETMIVVMATGNTPVLDWNIFNGLRTLSANIAVELPEAVRDSTLYRTLFLCALTLFVLTFIVNTIAELVRQRFRRRAMQL